MTTQPNPTPTPAPALGVLPEAVMTALVEYGDAAFACGEWTSDDDEPYSVPSRRWNAASDTLVAAITAALSQGEADAARLAGRERDAAFDVARVAHWLLNDSGYTKRHAARALADIARGLHREAAEQALDDARSTLSTARAGEASHG